MRKGAYAVITLLFCSICCFPQTTLVITDGLGTSVRLFRASDLTEIGHGIRPGGRAASSIAFSSNNTRLGFFSGGGDNLAVVDFNIGGTGAVVNRLHISPWSAAVSPDGKRLVAASKNDGAIYVYDIPSFKNSAKFTFGSLAGIVFGDLIISGSGCQTSSAPCAAFSFTNFGLLEADLSNLSCGPNCTGQVLSSSNVSLRGQGSTLVATPNGNYLIAALSNDDAVGIYNVQPPPLSPPQLSAVTLSDYVYAVAVANPNNGSDTYGFAVSRQSNLQATLSVVDLRPASANFGQILGSPVILGFPINFRPPREKIHTAISPDGTALYVTTGEYQASPNLVALSLTNLICAALSQTNCNPPIIASEYVPSSFEITGVSAVNLNSTVALQTQTSPSVTSVNQTTVPNGSPQTVTINGNGFATDGSAMVKVGSLDAMPGLNSTGTSIQVTIPAFSPAQGADIIVSNPNTNANNQADFYESGILRGAFVIATPSSFQPLNQVLVTNFPDGTLSVLNAGTGASVATSPFLGVPAVACAVTSDGASAFVLTTSVNGAEPLPSSVVPFNIVANQGSTPIPLSNDRAGFQDGIASAATNPSTNGPAIYTTYRDFSIDTGDHLRVIDATTNGLIEDISTISSDSGGFVPQALAVTPDGAHAYTFAFGSSLTSPVGDFLEYTINPAAFGFPQFSNTPQLNSADHIEISPDGKYLLTNCGGNWDQLCVLNIANPTNPSLVTAIPAPFVSTTSMDCDGGPGNGAGTGVWCPDEYRVVGNRLYVSDPVRARFDIFNFNPPDFSPVAGASFTEASSNFDVTPDNALLYAAETNSNAVAVWALKDPTNPSWYLATPIMLTRMGTGSTPIGIRVRPGTPTSVNVQLSSVQPIQQVQITYDNPALSSGSATTAVTTTNTNTTPAPTPSGFSLVGIPVYYNITTTATFTDAIVTFTFDQTQLTPAQISNLRVLHYDKSNCSAPPNCWDDVTVEGSLNTTNNTIQAHVLSFSPFTIGVGTTTFYFDSLLGKIATDVSAQGISNSFRAKAIAARAAFQRGDKTASKNQLNALLNAIQAQTGVSITTAQATDLTGEVQALLSSF
jgi:hypothetical protein